MYQDMVVFPLERPAVRPLELSPAEVDGAMAVVVRDPMGILEGPLVLAPNPLVLMFLELADGNTDLPEMAHILTQETGQIIPAEVLEYIAAQLDQALLLQSERFKETCNARVEAFRSAPMRTCSLLPRDSVDRLAAIKELSDEIRSHSNRASSPPAKLEFQPDQISAVMAPHIDYARGGAAYAWTYKTIKEHATHVQTWIILGTLHRPASHRFIATRKDFETPFGTLLCDKPLLAKIEDKFRGELYRDEFAHAFEHTIELQAIYLRHIFNGDNAPSIVPILVATFDDLLARPVSPWDVPEIRNFCTALRTLLQEAGNNVGIIASVDLSHCGPQFGDESPNDESRMADITAADKEALEAFESGDAERFFNTFRPSLNSQKVCSIAAIYCLMRIMEGRAKPKVLTYQYHNSQDRSCLVSFASAAFSKVSSSLPAPPN